MGDQYIFWDLETTGRNDKFDQITQVGAVLTDHNFEVKDKLEIHSKLREGKWFEPGALLTTGVDPLNLFKIIIQIIMKLALNFMRHFNNGPLLQRFLLDLIILISMNLFFVKLFIKILCLKFI